MFACYCMLLIFDCATHTDAAKAFVCKKISMPVFVVFFYVMVFMIITINCTIFNITYILFFCIVFGFASP